MIKIGKDARPRWSPQEIVILAYGSPFDLRFTLPVCTTVPRPARQARLRGIYPTPRVARRAGERAAAAPDWTFLNAMPALHHPDLAIEVPLLDLIEARPPTDAVAYGVIVEPLGPRYLLVAFGYPQPLRRLAQRADPAIQITELCHCLRLGFGQR